MLQKGTAEAVAYALMQEVMRAEDHTTGHSPGPGQQRASRGYVLALYAECLKVVKGGRAPGQTAPAQDGGAIGRRLAGINHP